MKQGSRGNRGLCPAFSALEQAPIFQPRLPGCRAVWTLEALRPAQPTDVVVTGALTVKPRLKLLEGSRVFGARGKAAVVYHDDTLYLVAGGVKCIPTLFIFRNAREIALFEYGQHRATIFIRQPQRAARFTVDQSHDPDHVVSCLK